LIFILKSKKKQEDKKNKKDKEQNTFNGMNITNVIRREISNLSKSPDLPFQVIEFNPDEQYVIARLHLSPDTMYYDSDSFDIRFSYTDGYPWELPVVQFIDNIPYHPQVDDEGYLNMQPYIEADGSYSNVITARLEKILLYVWIMLNDPLIIPCGDQQKKKLFQNNPDQFRKRALRMPFFEKNKMFLQAMRRLYPYGGASLSAPSSGRPEDDDKLTATLGKIIGLSDDVARQLWKLMENDRFLMKHAAKEYNELQLYLCCARVLDRYRDQVPLPVISSVLEELRGQMPPPLYESLMNRYISTVN